MRIPLINTEVRPPDETSLATYAGLGAMSLVGIVEWPITAAAIVGHMIGKHTTTPAPHEAAA